MKKSPRLIMPRPKVCDFWRSDASTRSSSRNLQIFTIPYISMITGHAAQPRSAMLKCARSAPSPGCRSPYRHLYTLSFANAAVGIFQMDNPEVQPHLGALAMVSIGVARVTDINRSTFCSFQGSQHFGLLVFPRFLACHRLMQVHVRIIHGFPLWSFESFKKWPGGRSANPRQQAAAPPPFFSSMCGVGKGAKNTFFMRSQRELTRAFPE